MQCRARKKGSVSEEMLPWYGAAGCQLTGCVLIKRCEKAGAPCRIILLILQILRVPWELQKIVRNYFCSISRSVPQKH